MPPSTILHLDNTVAELRRSPASVEHHHRHHAVVLTKLSLNTRLDRSSRDVIELNVCWTRRCRTFGTWIGRIVKTYDYINRVVITLPLTVYEGTWTTLSPLVAMPSPWSCVCVGNFLKLLRSLTKTCRESEGKNSLYLNIKEEHDLVGIDVLLVPYEEFFQFFNQKALDKTMISCYCL